MSVCTHKHTSTHAHPYNHTLKKSRTRILLPIGFVPLEAGRKYLPPDLIKPKNDFYMFSNVCQI